MKMIMWVVFIMLIRVADCEGQNMNDSVNLQIEKVFFEYHDGDSSVRFEGRLQNKSQIYPLIVYPYKSNKIFILEKYLSKFIYFELVKIDPKPEVDITENNMSMTIDGQVYLSNNYLVLNPKSDILIVCKPSIDYFRKYGTGLYKIRFVYMASLWNRGYNTVYSKWFTFYYK